MRAGGGRAGDLGGGGGGERWSCFCFCFCFFGSEDTYIGMRDLTGHIWGF